MTGPYRFNEARGDHEGKPRSARSRQTAAQSAAPQPPPVGFADEPLLGLTLRGEIAGAYEQPGANFSRALSPHVRFEPSH